MLRAQVLFLAALLPFVAGCGGTKFAPVSGRVTMGGKPLAGVVVSFQPIAESRNVDPGPGSTAITDADGRFTLISQLDKRTGAVVGKHRVRISPAGEGPAGDADAADPKTKKPAGPTIPAAYNSKSDLEFTVPQEGTDQANFVIDPGKGDGKGDPGKGGVPKGAIDS